MTPLASRLRASLLAHLDSARALIEGPAASLGGVPVSALEIAFEDHAAGLRARLGRVLMQWTLVMNALWLPTDLLLVTKITHGPELMRGARLAVLAGTLATLALLHRRRTLAGARLFMTLLVWMATCAAIAYTVMIDAEVGRTWLPFCMPMLIATMAVPVPLRHRVPALFALAASFLIGALLRGRAVVESPYLPTMTGYLIFMAGAGIAFGHAFHLLVRSNLHHHLALENKSAELESERAQLAEQVRERTEDLRQLSQHVERARELEGRRIARELHDEVGQGVSALRLGLAATRRRFEKSPSSIAGNLEELGELIARVADGTRQAIAHLRPQLLTSHGLVSAAEWLVKSTERRGGFRCVLRVEGESADGADQTEEAPISEAVMEVHTAAFRILQESLTNAVNHAGAQQLVVTLALSPAAIELEVRDDGVGLPPPPMRRRGMGLLGMRERASAVGGQLRVEPLEGGGTRVWCRLPLPGAPA